MHLSLNLLPPDRKQALRTGYVFAYAQTMLVLFLALTIIATATIFSVRHLVASTYEDLAGRSTDTSGEFKELSADIKEINAYLTRAEMFDRRAIAWSGIVKKITDLAPAGTKISRIRIAADGKIILTGVATTRTDVLTYDEKLRSNGSFTDVKSPLSNILQQREVIFDFELQLAGVTETKKP